MSTQAKTVLDLTYRRNHLRFARMMMADNALKDYHPTKLRAAVDALESLEREVLSLQRAARCRSHTVIACRPRNVVDRMRAPVAAEAGIVDFPEIRRGPQVLQLVGRIMF